MPSKISLWKASLPPRSAAYLLLLGPFSYRFSPKNTAFCVELGWKKRLFTM